MTLLLLVSLELHHVVHDGCIIINEEAFLGHTQNKREKMLIISSGASKHPCRRPCSTSNLSEHSPSSNRTHACTPSWNRRKTASILGGAPKRAKTAHRTAGPQSHKLWRDLDNTHRLHAQERVPFCRASSCRRRTTNEHHANRLALVQNVSLAEKSLPSKPNNRRTLMGIYVCALRVPPPRTHFYFPASSGQAVVTGVVPSSPRFFCLRFLSRIEISNPTARRFFVECC